VLAVLYQEIFLLGGLKLNKLTKCLHTITTMLQHGRVCFIFTVKIEIIEIIYFCKCTILVDISGKENLQTSLGQKIVVVFHHDAH